MNDESSASTTRSLRHSSRRPWGVRNKTPGTHVRAAAANANAYFIIRKMRTRALGGKIVFFFFLLFYNRPRLKYEIIFYLMRFYNIDPQYLNVCADDNGIIWGPLWSEFHNSSLKYSTHYWKFNKKKKQFFYLIFKYFVKRR